MTERVRFDGEAQRRFRRFLKGQGLNVSQARCIVLERALRMDRLFAAEDLVERLGSGSDRVSRGTVYRTLKLLVRAGLVRRSSGTTGHRYICGDLLSPLHTLQCDHCGTPVSVDDKEFRRALKRVCASRGFTLHRVAGVCRACGGEAPLA